MAKVVPRVPRELVARDRSKSVAITSTLLVETNINRAWVALVNTGGTDVYLRLGAAAVASEGIYLKAGGGALILDMLTTPWYGEISGIAITAASIVTCQEVERKV
jgi:hypothetical protein